MSDRYMYYGKDDIEGYTFATLEQVRSRAASAARLNRRRSYGVYRLVEVASVVAEPEPCEVPVTWTEAQAQ